MNCIDKSAARAEARVRRSAITAHERDGASTKAAAWFLKDFTLSKNSVISAYWPLPSELDCRPLLCALLDHGHHIALPVVMARTRTLSFRRWRPGDDLAKGNFGVFEPLADADEVMPNVVIVPFLAVNPQGFRLGYGGGYYDHTLRALRETAPDLLAVGLGFSAQEVAYVPYDENDEPLDWLVTEQGTRRFQRQRDFA